MAVKGTLNEISIVDLIQFNCQVGETCRLIVENKTQVAQIYFTEGTVVHTTLGEKEGEEAFNEILGWENGQFEIDRGFASPTRTITSNWSDLLLGGLHKLDEEKDAEQPTATELPELTDDLGEMLGFDKSFDFQYKLEEEENMSGLQDSLENISQEVTGFIATAIVGMDGLGVAGFTNTSKDVEVINAQMTLLFKLVNTTVDKLGAGNVETFLLTTDRAYLLIRYLADRNYYLGIAADRSKASLGNMHLFSRIFAERLSKEMPQ